VTELVVVATFVTQADHAFRGAEIHPICRQQTQKLTSRPSECATDADKDNAATAMKSGRSATSAMVECGTIPEKTHARLRRRRHRRSVVEDSAAKADRYTFYRVDGPYLKPTNEECP
jgi:hypothetical protein